ncbi:39S ribosomal protein L39-like protein [Dinothrombium tinctorium]|uniref:39S ribosomal protein L39-like protein n=1 Tax=Dinothrombium tinctorium TaxID=1965070 RepID=A0A3S3PX12_9ACAR|nr:39S ribosomal protein L39-like protein [Dinothrombium tinctorium]RWS03401.1 39S ribosomal protein L39-like protein [Dinothrombium tinctorium]RWS17945.1 39S ribosomal protein L39-like protein [Dinothrombium tinctorium]
MLAKKCLLNSNSPLTAFTAFKFIENGSKCVSTAVFAQNVQQSSAHRSVANTLFDEQKKKKFAEIGRIRKIEVRVKNVKPDEEVTLIMNENISTPFNCAQHIHELFVKRSVVAEIDNGVLWDMHRPLTHNCALNFRHFKEEDPRELNKIFWRSCSFLLGMVIEKTFKDNIPVLLHSWPKPDVKSGSFVYDVELPSLSNWKPTESELRTLTAMFWKIRQSCFKFERLDVNIDIAKELFAHNHHKIKQLDSILTNSKETHTISVYRVNDHIDYSIGPMIPDTSYVGRVTVSSVHQISANGRKLYRFQGIAIPSQLRINFFAYRVLMDRSQKLNRSPFPSVF